MNFQLTVIFYTPNGTFLHNAQHEHKGNIKPGGVCGTLMLRLRRLFFINVRLSYATPLSLHSAAGCPRLHCVLFDVLYLITFLPMGIV